VSEPRAPTSDPPPSQAADRLASSGPPESGPKRAVRDDAEAKPARKPRTPLVQVEKLSKLYPVRGGLMAKPRFVHAVDGVTFYVRHGETLGLVGESGCGKSTLGRTMIRLVEPTLGRIVFDGKDLTRMPPDELRAIRRRMQIVFQDPYSSLNPRMTVREIVGEGVAIFRLAATRADADALVADALRKVGLRPDMMGRYPHEFSGGQRQRIGIARALAVRPEFIVCDEPVSALDVSVQAQVINLLEELQEELSVSLLFISHDLRVVEYVSHRMAVMYLGRVVEMGPTADVAGKRHHPYTRALFAAMPSADGKRRLLQGEPPSAVDPPKGCAFHPRCPNAEPGKCDVETPELQELVPGTHHRVACWHPEI
jgi:oligopeptide/dipeptide ABC transporter ATP-binding protein